MLNTQSSNGPKFSLKFFLGIFFCLSTFVSAEAQISLAPMKRLGDRIACHVGGKTFELTPNKRLIYKFQFAPSDAETQKVFDEVEPYTHLVTPIYTIPVEDEINVLICPSDGGMNFIAFSAAWLKRIYDQTNSRWTLYGIIAHEIGHYALNHDRTHVSSDHDIELEADRYAGEILAQMGASEDQAQTAYKSDLMRYPHNIDTHPPIEQRLVAVREGWTKGRRCSNPAASEQSGSATEGVIRISRDSESANTFYRGGPKDEFRFQFKVATIQFNTRADVQKHASKLTDASGTYNWDNKMYYWSKNSPEDRLLLAWTNATKRTFGWVIVESVGNRWYYRSNADDDWTPLERGEKAKIEWDSSGQTIVVSLKAPNLTRGWTTDDIQYSFGYSN